MTNLDTTIDFPLKPKRKVPYAVGNFEEIRKNNYYFVDKTRFIRNLEKYKAPAFLRPRRFGKTLWCSILECYYDVNRAGRFDELFGGLDIGRAPTPERNQYMVMRFNFSEVRVSADIGVMGALGRVGVPDAMLFEILQQGRGYGPGAPKWFGPG